MSSTKKTCAVPIPFALALMMPSSGETTSVRSGSVLSLDLRAGAKEVVQPNPFGLFSNEPDPSPFHDYIGALRKAGGGAGMVRGPIGAALSLIPAAGMVFLAGVGLRLESKRRLHHIYQYANCLSNIHWRANRESFRFALR